MSAAAVQDEPYRPQLNVRLMCPECRVMPPDIVERFSEGDMVCGSCGLVLGDRIVDTRSEWRTFSNDDEGNDDPSRVGDGGDPLLGNTLETVIGPSANQNKELYRLQNKPKSRNDLQGAFGKIAQMCETFSLPKMVQESAKEAYKVVHDDRKLKGKRSQESIMAASIFIACRHSGVGRTFKEISSFTNVSEKEIGRTLKVMKRLLINNTSYSSSSSNSQTNAEDLLHRFCSHLGLPANVTKAAEHIALRVKEDGTLAGRSPTSIAAATIYLASNLFQQRLPLTMIANKTGVSEGTIKTSYKYLWEARDRLVDKDWNLPHPH
jgi:transcription initiation factor TFIIB